MCKTITVKIFDTEVTDRNGIKIPKDVLEEAINNYLKYGNRFGRIRTQIDDLSTGYSNYSHYVKSIEFIGDEAFADIDLLDTFDGKCLQNMDSELIESRFEPILFGAPDSSENENKLYKHVDLLSIDLF